MKILEIGYKYKLDNFNQESESQVISFVRREIDSETGELKTFNNGITNEEVIFMLLNRINYLDNKLPCEENKQVIGLLKQISLTLHKRTMNRHLKGIKGTNLNLI